MPLKTGLFIFLSGSFLAYPQSAPKQLTARELFYAAATPAAPKATNPKTPPRPAPRPVRSPADSAEVARANPAPARPLAAPPDPAPVRPAPTPDPAPAVVRTSAQTAALPANGEPPLGIRYKILKINGDSSTEVPADTVFHSGDRIRFEIEPNASGYLYIINKGSSGTWKPMFPSPEVEDGSNHVEGFRPYMMPPKSRLAFDTNAGTENLFIVFSRVPEPDLEQVIYSLEGKKARKPEEPVAMDKTLIMAVNIENPTVDRLRNAYGRDLIVEKVDPNTPGDRKETAVYVVNPTGSNESRVTADLRLVHQ